MEIVGKLREGILQGFKILFDAEIEPGQINLQPTNPEFEGSHTFVVFPFLKITKKSPEESANILGQYLKDNLDIVQDFNAVKGFLNLVINESSWLKLFEEYILSDSFGEIEPKNQTIMVEYSSPNTNKPLHLGHLRNNFLGYSISEILKANGYNVVKANLINDRGIHICKSMLAYQKYGNEETPQSSGLKGDHLIGKYYVLFDKHYKQQMNELVAGGMDEEKAKAEAPLLKEAQGLLLKWEEGDLAVVALWEKLNSWVYEGFDHTYKVIGVNFDQYYYESKTYLLGKNLVEEGLQKGIFYKKDNGSVWVDLRPEGLDEKLLLRSDGTSVYMTQDLGTADLKYQDYKVDKSIYVVGNEQDYHFKVLQLVLQKMGKPYADGIYHLSYGMVDLPSGRMKSREGTVVDADQLVEEMLETAENQTRELGKIEGFSEEQLQKLYSVLGLGALKFFLLKVDPKKRMLFNPQESIEFQGNTGPFIQYTYARISSIRRRAEGLGIEMKTKFDGLEVLDPAEIAVIRLLNDFTKKLKEAGDLYSPAILAQYVFDLAKEYNRFYAELSIFGEEDKEKLSFRIVLSVTVAQTIKRTMALLGIEVPERM
jgi:arginyl-tRNA synthetase